MPDYDLSGLSSRSFEQLIQALAVQVLGAGVVVFGDGPDGGREATFDGTVPIHQLRSPGAGISFFRPSSDNTLEGGRKDLDWLKRQLTSEFQKYHRRKQKLENQSTIFLRPTSLLLAWQRLAVRMR